MQLIEEKNPLKQGLKRFCLLCVRKVISIEEKNPLKQGLKLLNYRPGLKLQNIEEKNPLKQGLKQNGDIVAIPGLGN